MRVVIGLTVGAYVSTTRSSDFDKYKTLACI